MKILGIETSCDETSAAVWDTRRGLLSNIVASQVDIHAKTGGIVPEVASRAHVGQIIPVIDESLKAAETDISEIGFIAITYAPGLIGSLLIGANTAKTLSAFLDKPVLPINHLEGHIYANFIKENNAKKEESKNRFRFPAVILLVSGGHTSLILMKDYGKYKYLGETLDDAAGEAFDKAAKILDLPYPGGPNISNMAEKYRDKPQNTDNKKNSRSRGGDGAMFPRPMIDSGDFDFSFSGLKTAVLYAWQKEKNKNEEAKKRFAFEFEEAAIDVLVTKTILAAKKYKAKTVSICGGVAANKKLRGELEERVKKELKNVNLSVPEIRFCGDNAAMIACAASYDTKRSGKIDFEVESSKNL